jgi:Ser/Thr protein kinase RdoA (MazF antagonist)
MDSTVSPAPVRDRFSCTALVAVLVAPAVAVAVTLAPRDGRPVAVWAGVDATATFGLVTRAGGLPLDLAAWPGLVIARSDEPGFAARLVRAGAYLVFDAPGAGLCAPDLLPKDMPL